MKKSTIMASTVIAAGTYFFTQCKCLKNSYYNIINKKIPESFDGYKIIQLSDLHNCYFGPIKHNYLIYKIDKEAPDVILITGDFFDVNKYENSLSIVKELAQKYKIYFIAGGHEYWVPEFSKIKSELKKVGVTIVDNKRIELFNKNESIYITGLLDPTFYNGCLELSKKILKEYQSEDKFNILLSHRPDLFDLYTSYDYDLIFTGHAHGGQIRILNQGLYAPNQGILPKYTSGIHSKDDKHMIINRGCGWHSLFIKINNRPEIVVCKLQKKHLE